MTLEPTVTEYGCSCNHVAQEEYDRLSTRLDIEGKSNSIILFVWCMA